MPSHVTPCHGIPHWPTSELHKSPLWSDVIVFSHSGRMLQNMGKALDYSARERFSASLSISQISALVYLDAIEARYLWDRGELILHDEPKQESFVLSHYAAFHADEKINSIAERHWNALYTVYKELKKAGLQIMVVRDKEKYQEEVSLLIRRRKGTRSENTNPNSYERCKIVFYEDNFDAEVKAEILAVVDLAIPSHPGVAFFTCRYSTLSPMFNSSLSPAELSALT